MKDFDTKSLEISTYLRNNRKPDFNNLLKILERGKPERPTLFEFFLNEELYKKLAGIENENNPDGTEWWKTTIKAFCNAGYDYTTVGGSDFGFPTNRKSHNSKTISLNEGAIIFDRESFKQYAWPDPDSFDYSRLDTLKSDLPEGMKLIVSGPRGVLENVIGLTMIHFAL